MADEDTSTETTEDETTDEKPTETTSEESTSSEPDWKRESRKHERRAKEAAKKLAEYEAKLAEVDEANKTEQEKAIEKARQEAAEEAMKAAAVELRAERLSAAIAREAAKDFADVDDAIRLLDTEDDDLFDDDGKVQTDSLKSALADLLERKPHLKADAGRPTGGSSDAGKGGSGAPSLEEMSVEDHLKAIRRT